MLNPYEGGKFKVTSTYGNRTLNGSTEFHSGLGLVGLSSKNLLAICDGVVQQSRIIIDKSNLTWQWGNYVCIKADTGELVFYCHLSERKVKKGDRVKVGDIIGVEGNTGYSFGSHCHLEVRNSDNKTTSSVNTPTFMDIPNKTGSYEINKEEEPMTTAEKKEFDALVARVKELETALATKENAERVWHYWDEIKKDAKWAYAPLMAMYKAGYFQGASASDLKLGQTKMENLVIIARVLKADGKIDY